MSFVQLASRPGLALVARAALLAFVVLGTGQASAQEVTGDNNKHHRIVSPAGLGPSYSGLAGAGIGVGTVQPTIGIRAGDFVLQPRLFVEGKYSTNFFRVDTRNVDGEEIGVFAFHIRPGLALFNPEFDIISITLGIDADVQVPIHEKESVTAQTDVGGRANASITLFPKGVLAFTLDEVFERQLWTRPASSQRNANVNRNQLGASLAFRPGGGALNFKLAYHWDIDRYDDSSQLDLDRHRFGFLASWRFYPMTYAFIETTFRLSEYTDPIANAAQSTGNEVDGKPFKVYAGLSGYITERFAVLFRIGYGNSFLNDQGNVPAVIEDFSSVIGMLQLTFRFGQRTALHAGGARDFGLVAFGGHRTYWRGYLSFEQQLGDIALLHVDGSYDAREYGTWQPTPLVFGGQLVTPTVSEPQRKEQAIKAGLLIDFNISRLFGTTLGYRFETQLSDYNISFPTPNGTVQNFVGYTDHRIFLSANLRY